MSYQKGVDVSFYQGTINWKAVNVPIVMIKMSGGDAGLYLDPRAAINYKGAVKAGKAVGGYHFGGGKLKPEIEADYFVKAMSPLAENDVMALDCEAYLARKSDVVKWCTVFMQRVHDKTGIWPLIYMSLSTFNAHNWTPVTKNCGLWLAAWNNNPNGNLTKSTYVMHQYSDKGVVPGIKGYVDLDAWFGTINQFKKYGYHKPKVVTNVPISSKPKTINPTTDTAPKPPITPVIPPTEVQPETPAKDNPVTGQTDSPAEETSPKVTKPFLFKILEIISNVLNKLTRRS